MHIGPKEHQAQDEKLATKVNSKDYDTGAHEGHCRYKLDALHSRNNWCFNR